MEPDVERVGDAATGASGDSDEFTGVWLAIASPYIRRIATTSATVAGTEGKKPKWARRVFPLARMQGCLELQDA